MTTRNIHNTHPGRIQTRNPSKPAAADPRLRLHGHWDRSCMGIILINIDSPATFAVKLKTEPHFYLLFRTLFLFISLAVVSSVHSIDSPLHFISDLTLLRLIPAGTPFLYPDCPRDKSLDDI